MPDITVRSGKEKYTLKKSELYGYKDCHNEIFRFYKNAEYKIAEAGNLLIYVKERNISVGKSYKVVQEYFFSTEADSALMPLTLHNLRNVYSSNEKFCDLISEYFSLNDVNTYDAAHRTFAVNYLYTRSLK